MSGFCASSPNCVSNSSPPTNKHNLRSAKWVRDAHIDWGKENTSEFAKHFGKLERLQGKLSCRGKDQRSCANFRGMSAQRLNDGNKKCRCFAWPCTCHSHKIVSYLSVNLQSYTLHFTLSLLKLVYGTETFKLGISKAEVLESREISQSLFPNFMLVSLLLVLFLALIARALFTLAIWHFTTTQGLREQIITC